MGSLLAQVVLVSQWIAVAGMPAGAGSHSTEQKPRARLDAWFLRIYP